MRKLVVMVLLATVFAGGSLAADDQFVVRVDSRVGFAGLFKPGRWTPIELTLQNLGPDISGTLTVNLARRDRFGPHRYINSYERRLDLASGAVKNFSLVLPLETAVYPIEVVVSHGENPVLVQEVKLVGRSAGNSLVAVLSRRPSLDFLLPVFNSARSRSLDLVYPLIDYLPDRWEGYDGVDLLVIHDARLQALSHDQVLAIRNWVAAGGRVVVSAGAHLGAADSVVLEELTGMVPRAVNVATVAELGLQQIGLPVLPSEADLPVVVSLFDTAPSVILHTRLGRGEIVVLPFDYSQFVRVAPATSLGMWTTLLPRAAVLDDPVERDSRAGTAQLADPETSAEGRVGLVPTAVSRRVFETDPIVNQLDLPLYSFPSVFVVAGLAVSFFVVAMGIFIWISRGEGRLGPLVGTGALVMLGVLTSLLAHMTLTVGQQPAETLALSLEVAELGPEDEYAIVTKDIVLFSRKRADYLVRFDGNPLVVPFEYRGQVVRTNGPDSELRMEVGRWGHENTVAVQVEPFEVTAKVQRGIGYANVEMHNRSGFPVDGIVVLNNGFPSLVGRLMPSDVTEHVVMGAGVGRWEEIDWMEFVPPGSLSQHQAQFLQDLAQAQRSDPEDRSSLLVIGWRPSPLIKSTVEPEFARHIELNAMVMRLETSPAAGGDS